MEAAEGPVMESGEGEITGEEHRADEGDDGEERAGLAAGAGGVGAASAGSPEGAVGSEKSGDDEEDEMPDGVSVARVAPENPPKHGDNEREKKSGDRSGESDV